MCTLTAAAAAAVAWCYLRCGSRISCRRAIGHLARAFVGLVFVSNLVVASGRGRRCTPRHRRSPGGGKSLPPRVLSFIRSSSSSPSPGPIPLPSRAPPSRRPRASRRASRSCISFWSGRRISCEQSVSLSVGRSMILSNGVVTERHAMSSPFDRKQPLVCRRRANGATVRKEPSVNCEGGIRTLSNRPESLAGRCSVPQPSPGFVASSPEPPTLECGTDPRPGPFLFPGGDDDARGDRTSRPRYHAAAAAAAAITRSDPTAILRRPLQNPPPS